MSKDYEEIRADELAVGDTIRLRFMGGEEDVTIDDLYQLSLSDDDDDSLISWRASNSVIGPVSDVVKPDKVVRRVD